jgi:hypothetical protein
VGSSAGACRLSPVSCQPMRCPLAPALPWGAWASLPHLRRSDAPRRLPPPHRGGLRVALAAPRPAVLPWCVGSPQGSGPGGSARSRPGLGSPRPGLWARRPVVLPRARVPPLAPCPALRPRWGPRPAPSRVQDGGLPARAPRRLPRVVPQPRPTSWGRGSPSWHL